MNSSQILRCTVCRQKITRAILLDGFVTHPTCDDRWTALERFAPLEAGRSSLGVIACSQQHEALVRLGQLDAVTSCPRCSTKLYRTRTDPSWLRHPAASR